jgi:hypothetical protein
LFPVAAVVMMDRMSEHGGGADEAPRDDFPRSRLYDYVEMTAPPRERAADRSQRPAAGSSPERVSPDGGDVEAQARGREFAALLGEFRRTPVLVPLGDGPGPAGERGMLTADWNGVRFILAFSDEQALARYARERGAFAREWTYQTVLGARLLDVAVPAAGVPCGVALDCADGPDGMVFPPVRGIVPDEAALDFEAGDEA